MVVMANTVTIARKTVQLVTVIKYYPDQKNRYSRDIHEIVQQCDHEISCDIEFDLQRKLATCRYRESRRCRTVARYRTLSHDRTVDQPHEFLGCNDFLARVVERHESCKLASPLRHRTQSWLSCASDSSHPLRFLVKRAPIPDLDMNCESCVAPDSPNLSIVTHTVTHTNTHARARTHTRVGINIVVILVAHSGSIM